MREEDLQQAGAGHARTPRYAGKKDGAVFRMEDEAQERRQVRRGVRWGGGAGSGEVGKMLRKEGGTEYVAVDKTLIRSTESRICYKSGMCCMLGT